MNVCCNFFTHSKIDFIFYLYNRVNPVPQRYERTYKMPSITRIIEIFFDEWSNTDVSHCVSYNPYSLPLPISRKRTTLSTTSLYTLSMFPSRTIVELVVSRFDICFLAESLSNARLEFYRCFSPSFFNVPLALHFHFPVWAAPWPSISYESLIRFDFALNGAKLDDRTTPASMYYIFSFAIKRFWFRYGQKLPAIQRYSVIIINHLLGRYFRST